MLGLFGVLGLGLALIGTYGLLAFSVAQRRRDLGIRAALGAGPARLVRLVVGQGMRPVALGLLIGAIAAVATGRLLEGMLYGVSGRDPLVLGVVALVLVTAGLLATWLPARRAARVQPVVALK